MRLQVPAFPAIFKVQMSEHRGVETLWTVGVAGTGGGLYELSDAGGRGGR